VLKVQLNDIKFIMPFITILKFKNSHYLFYTFANQRFFLNLHLDINCILKIIFTKLFFFFLFNSHRSILSKTQLILPLSSGHIIKKCIWQRMHFFIFSRSS
jgi:hypothetical protein